MTRHKKLSSISIAAVALFAVSVPCFAQGQSDSRGETSSQAAIAVAQPTLLAMNRENLAPRRATVATRANHPNLSLGMFTKAASEVSATDSQRFVTSKAMIFELNADVQKQQFRADDVNEPQRPKVSFIASRGQKSPTSNAAEN